MDYRRRRVARMPALLQMLLLQLLLMIGGTHAYFDESEMRGECFALFGSIEMFVVCRARLNGEINGG